MGYYVTSSVLDPHPLLKNRVVGSRAFSFNGARKTASQPLESHQDTTPIVTIFASGRQSFWTVDAFEGVSSMPLSLHKYLYVGGDPVSFADPSGHGPLLWTLLAAACIGDIIYFSYHAGHEIKSHRTLAYVERNATAADLNAIAGALNFYELDHGSVPPDDLWVAALFRPQQSARPWAGAYFDKIKLKNGVPVDFWGNPYVYHRGDPSTSSFTLDTMGPDGVYGTEDDIHYRTLNSDLNR